MAGKYGNWLMNHDVEYCKGTREICKQRRNIGGTTKYGKWQELWQVSENYVIKRGL